ncbi:hypothetical protein ENSA5_12890 [Enhygromyxa salina]|uniref:Uncharacterized protein n=1 Tax=Enhygromyxa salina TaxID=215803 RepID=A0A2S9YF85_9BACT|nr:hypothetical protein [Enhygromyxa salina]PRQ03739.1 hypothetical protein ENSA5_12890 [Enhygromyxa salina]
MTDAGQRRARRTWYREPLIQFAAIGLALLGGARLVGLAEPRATIVVSDDTLARLEADLTRSLGRAPTEAELDASLRAWADDEMLYREARARGLDRSDPIIRRRLTQKMQFLLEDTAGVEAMDELRDRYEVVIEEPR